MQNVSQQGLDNVRTVRVSSSDAGTLAGQQAVNGQLSQLEESNRWVRDAQRMRIHVTLNEPLDKTLPTGPALLSSSITVKVRWRDFSPGCKFASSAGCIMSINTLALSISTFYNVQYGVFFVVYPVMLLSLVPVFHRHVATQFVVNNPNA